MQIFFFRWNCKTCCAEWTNQDKIIITKVLISQRMNGKDKLQAHQLCVVDGREQKNTLIEMKMKMNKQINKPKHKYTRASTESINILASLSEMMCCCCYGVWRVKLSAKVDIILDDLTLSWAEFKRMNTPTQRHTHKFSHPCHPFKIHQKFHTNKASSHALVEVYLVRVVNENRNKVVCHTEHESEMICK